MRDRQGTFSDKHHARALDAIATDRCSCDLTDGFCGPRDGECQRPGRHTRGTCTAHARSALSALASRGMMAVWVYDKELPDEVRSHLIRAYEERDSG